MDITDLRFDAFLYFLDRLLFPIRYLSRLLTAFGMINVEFSEAS